MAAGTETHYRTCPFCEATCGIEVTMSDGEPVGVRGDEEDVLSHGFLCPKATGLEHLQRDPDRLRTPLVKQPDGTFAEATWEEALRVVDERLSAILAEHGRDCGGRLHRQPQRAQPLRAALRAGVAARTRVEERVHREHGRPDSQAPVGRPHVRRAALDPDTGRGPHAAPAHPRRQPARVEREPAHRAGHARPPSRDPRAGRQGRGRGPAAHPHGRGRRRAPLHPAGRRRAPAAGHRPHPRRGGPDLPRPPERAPERAGADRPTWPGASRPRRCRRRAASTRTRSAGWPASWRPRRAPPSTGASAPARRSSGRSRPGWWT